MELHALRCTRCNRHVPVYLIFREDSEGADDGEYCRVCATEQEEAR